MDFVEQRRQWRHWKAADWFARCERARCEKAARRNRRARNWTCDWHRLANRRCWEGSCCWRSFDRCMWPERWAVVRPGKRTDSWGWLVCRLSVSLCLLDLPPPMLVWLVCSRCSLCSPRRCFCLSSLLCCLHYDLQ